MPRTGDVCLVTAVTDSFVPGAVAMLGSFRVHHPGFEGDVVVLHDDGLSEASRTVLAAIDGRVRFEPVRPALLDRVASFAAAYPGLIRPQWCYALDAYRLGGYRKVLYCDSDVLFQGPVGELFDTGAELLCCGDRPCLLGQMRDAETLMPVAHTAARLAGRGRPVLERTFNSGFQLIDASCTGEQVYAELLASIAPEAWRGNATRLGDQGVLNRYFAGRQTLVSWTYNYLVPDGPDIRARTGLDAAHAKVLHFKGPVNRGRRTPCCAGRAVTAHPCTGRRAPCSGAGTTPTRTSWRERTCARRGRGSVVWTGHPRVPAGRSIGMQVGSGRVVDGSLLPVKSSTKR